MRVPHLHTPHFSMPHFSMPHFGRHAHDMAPGNEHHHHRPAFQTLKRVEGGFDLLIVALVVILAAAMIWGLATTTGHPAYFDRWPG